MNKKLTLGMASLALLGATLTTVNVEAASNKGGTIFNTGVINSFKTENVQVGEHNISYMIRKGKTNPSKTYILSHGATGTSEFMKVMAAEIANKEPNARIIIVDLPLHGKSTGPMDNIQDITVNTYTDIMYDFLDLKTQDGTIKGDVNWVGWSMGGSIGMLLDLKGAKIDQLTLLNSSGYWAAAEPFIDIMPPSVIKEVFYQVVASQLENNLTNKERQDILNNYNNLITSSSEIMSRDFAAILPEHYDIREQLKNIDAKTLIIGGTEDVVALPEQQEVMDNNIPNSKLVMYEDTHAQLVKPQQAKRIVKEMQQFFK